MVDEKMLREAIKWCKENGYEHILENEDLVIAVYRKKVLGESIYGKKSGGRKVYPFKRLDEMEVGDRGRVVALVVEVVREKKTKKGDWQVRLIAGDESKMMDFFSYPSKEKPEIDEMKYYLFEGKMNTDGLTGKNVFGFWKYEEVDKEVVDKVSIVKDYIDTLGDGKWIKKDKFEKIVGEDMKEKIIEVMGLKDVGDKYELGTES